MFFARSDWLLEHGIVSAVFPHFSEKKRTKQKRLLPAIPTIERAGKPTEALATQANTKLL